LVEVVVQNAVSAFKTTRTLTKLNRMKKNTFFWQPLIPELKKKGMAALLNIATSFWVAKLLTKPDYLSRKGLLSLQGKLYKKYDENLATTKQQQHT